MLIRIFFTIVLMLPNAVFAGGNAWWLTDSADCDLNGTDLNYYPFYAKEGHENTTYVVARIAGHGRFDAKKLACYSQMPDTEVMRLSAPAVGVWGVFAWEYRHLIVANLHSLHGGNAENVKTRRTKLAELIKQGVSDQIPVWKTGFMIHAMGDSYAHVSGSGENIKAYGELFGHIFAFSEKPDNIAHDENFTHYKLYVEELYKALEQSAASKSELNRFIASVEAAAKTGNEEEVVKAITGFKLNDFLSELKSNPTEQVQVENMPVKEIFSSDDEKEFLRWLRSQLEG